jgi:hypothetical protein
VAVAGLSIGTVAPAASAAPVVRKNDRLSNPYACGVIVDSS